MELTIIGTGSKGNSYYLKPSIGKGLLIECGVNHKDIKKAIDFNVNGIEGCLVTHEHNDHAKSIKEIAAMGINVYASRGTIKAKQCEKHHKVKALEVNKATKIGDYKIYPFEIKHDAEEPVGFIINHKESGNILFLTDSVYSPYRFKNLNNIILEVNYDEETLTKNADKNIVNSFLENRIINSHFSLENAIELFKANDLSKVNNIIIIHLSDTNSNEKRFKETIEKEVGKEPIIADNNMNINLSKNPF